MMCQIPFVLLKLHQIHSIGFVHGDIRDVNLLYTEDNAHNIIDVDFANFENAEYVSGFLNSGRERHPEAEANQPMKKAHDRYSLNYLITKSSLLDITTSQRDILDKMINFPELELDVIASELDQSSQ